jgi:hypothetical protein
VLAKEALSRETETTIPVVLPTTNTVVRLTRAELEGRDPAGRRADDLGVPPGAVVGGARAPRNLSAVLVAGGSSRDPAGAGAAGRPTSAARSPATRTPSTSSRSAPRCGAAPRRRWRRPAVGRARPAARAASGRRAGPACGDTAPYAVPRPAPGFVPPARVTMQSVHDLSPASRTPRPPPARRRHGQARDQAGGGVTPGRTTSGAALGHGRAGAAHDPARAVRLSAGAPDGDVRVANQGPGGRVHGPPRRAARRQRGGRARRSRRRRFTPSLAGLDLPGENITTATARSRCGGCAHVLAGPFEGGGAAPRRARRAAGGAHGRRAPGGRAWPRAAC